RTYQYSTSLPSAIFSLNTTDYDRVPPFYQRAQLLGPANAVVRVTAHVDDGSSRNLISLARWKRYGHCLGNLLPATRRLSVADGKTIWPNGRCRGEVAVGGVRVLAWFDVFDCRGAFDVILGKPWLHSVRAIHNYENDEIQIR
ncbi:hypothetical protein B0H10DRAFT_1891427, partial [Mycena sp. CBHHK59/15]